MSDRVPVAEGKAQLQRLLLAVQRPWILPLLHEKLGHPVERRRDRRRVVRPFELRQRVLQVAAGVRYLAKQRAGVGEVKVGMAEGQRVAEVLRRGQGDPLDGQEVLREATAGQEHRHDRGDLPAVDVQAALGRAGQQCPDHGQLRVAPGPRPVVGREALDQHARTGRRNGDGQRQARVTEGHRPVQGPQVVIE